MYAQMGSSVRMPNHRALPGILVRLTVEILIHGRWYLILGTVLPISLACVAPTLLSPTVSYKLLLTDSDSFFRVASPDVRSSPTLVTRSAPEPCAQVRSRYPADFHCALMKCVLM